MIIDKETWEKLKELFAELYRDYDKFGDNTKNMIDNIDICIDDINNSVTDKVYAILYDAVVDDDMEHYVMGISITKSDAKEIYDKAVNDLKDDVDFNDLDAINVDNASDECDDWCYSETNSSFELYMNGRYNSNSFSIKIEELNLNHNVEKSKNKEME